MKSKYVAMMRAVASCRSHDAAAAEWQAAAEAFEQLYERLRESTALLRRCIPPADVSVVSLLAANEATLKKAAGE